MGVQLDVGQKTLLLPGEGETITDRPARTVRILAAHEHLDVTWSRYETGERGPDPHVHHEHADAFYVIEGELEFGLGPKVEPVRALAGSLVVVPPDVVHTFGNEGDATALFLNFHAPGKGFADSMRARRDGQKLDGGLFDSFDPPADGGRDAADALVLGPDGGELFDRGDRVVVIKADEPQLSAFDLTFGPESEGVDPHHHADHVDSFFVLEGEVEFLVRESRVLAGPGAWVWAPPGAVHGFRNPGIGWIRLLNFHAPDDGFAESIRGR